MKASDVALKIVAALGFLGVALGDALRRQLLEYRDPRTGEPVVVAVPDLPAPKLTYAVNPRTKQDQEKMGTGLNMLCADDGVLKYEFDPELGQGAGAGGGRGLEAGEKFPKPVSVHGKEAGPFGSDSKRHFPWTDSARFPSACPEGPRFAPGIRQTSCLARESGAGR